MRMEELMMMRLFSGGFGSTIDWTMVFTFVAFAVIYVLLPVLGYPAERRGLILGSLYFLIGDAALSLMQIGVLYVETIGRPGRTEATIQNIVVAFTILKMLLFLVALILFVVGLQGLRLRRMPPRGEPGPIDLGQDPRYQER
jgi:hypothetical protein